MSATLTPPGAPPASPIAGATQGMPAPPRGNLQAMFQQNVQGSLTLIKILSQTPGVDQAKLQQAVQLLRQGMTMLGEAVPKGGAPGAAPGGAPGGAPGVAPPPPAPPAPPGTPPGA
jgi:hypothetical protein